MKSPSPVTSADSLLKFLREFHVVDASQLRDVIAGSQKTFANASELAGYLRERGLITSWQSERLLNGRGRELQFGEYCLLEPLGKGGMGQVFKARHQLMNRYAAIKIIRQEFASHPQAVERFRREIRLAAQMSHPNIVTVHDAKQIGDRLTLIMEYCDGKTLGALIRENGRLSVAQACGYCRQAALGLQYASERDLIHRDVKPDNLFLSGETVKVLDFGLARLRKSNGGDATGSTLTAENTVIGTPDYMAPEQALDLRRADSRSDIYSLGCTLYFLLSGQVPFPGGTVQEKLLRHQTESPQSLQHLRKGLPIELCAVVEKMMHKDPAARYQTCGETADALTPFTHLEAEDAVTEHWIGGASGLATEQSPTFRSPVQTPITPPKAKMKSSRRLAIWLSIAVMGLVGLVLFVGVVIFAQNRFGVIGAKKASLKKAVKNDDASSPWELRNVLKGQPNRINCLAFSGDSSLLAVACGPLGVDKEKAASGILIWDMKSGRKKHFLKGDARPGYLQVAFRPGKRKDMLLAAGVGYWDWDTNESEVQLWDPVQGKRHGTIRAHRDGISCVTFSPDGNTLVTVGRVNDKTVRFWNVDRLLQDAANAPRTVINETSPALVRSETLPEMLSWASYSPAGDKLAVATYNRAIFLWEKKGPAEWEQTRIFRYPEQFNSPDVFQIAFSPDGKLLAAATANHQEPDKATPHVFLWNLEKPNQEPLALPHPSDVWSIAFTPDGKYLFSGERLGWLRLWDIRSGKELAKRQTHGEWVYVVLAPDGRTLATGGEVDRLVKLWEFRK